MRLRILGVELLVQTLHHVGRPHSRPVPGDPDVVHRAARTDGLQGIGLLKHIGQQGLVEDPHAGPDAGRFLRRDGRGRQLQFQIREPAPLLRGFVEQATAREGQDRR